MEKLKNLNSDLKKIRYEQIENHRKQIQKNPDGQKGRRHLQQESQSSPIRITYDTSRLDDIPSINVPGGQTMEVFEIIEDALNISRQYFQDVIKVYRETSNIVIQDTANVGQMGYQGQCTQQLSFSSTLGDDTTTGIPNSDLHIYVVYYDNNDGSLAYASACQWINFRPLVGYIAFNYNWFEKHFDGTMAGLEYNLETTIHELFHVIGFGSNEINAFLDGKNGNIYSNIEDIKDTVQWNEKTSIRLKSPEVLKAAKDHYNCSSLQGMLLENEGQPGTKDDHWERSLMRNELMTAAGIQSDAVTSIFTLAFLKDSNWYADIDLTYAEDMQWGHNKGCDFFDNICYSEYDYPEFRGQADKDSCSYHRFGVGKPSVTENIDNCPVINLYSDWHCTNPGHYQQDYHSKTGEIFNIHSKCFESTIIEVGLSVDLQFRCFPYRCFDNNVAVIQISDVNIICTQDGQVLNAPDGFKGNLQCPQFLSEFCNFPVPCENYCSMKGYCIRQKGISKCHCIDGYQGSDCSQKCPQSGCTSSLDCDQNQNFNIATKTCEECHPSCRYSCTGPTENDCSFCPKDKVWSNGQCVDACPTGAVLDSKQPQICIKPCQSNCDNELPKNTQSFIIKFGYQMLLFIALFLIL